MECLYSFIITPGADWAYAISAGIKGKVVVPAVAGMLFGHFITILLVAAGVGLLVANNPTALMILTVAGSAYLLWMGINLLLTLLLRTSLVLKRLSHG